MNPKAGYKSALPHLDRAHRITMDSTVTMLISGKGIIDLMNAVIGQQRSGGRTKSLKYFGNGRRASGISRNGCQCIACDLCAAGCRESAR